MSTTHLPVSSFWLGQAAALRRQMAEADTADERRDLRFYYVAAFQRARHARLSQ